MLLACSQFAADKSTQLYWDVALSRWDSGASASKDRFALTLRRLMSYIYGAPILDVSRSHTTTQHSR